MKKLLGILVLGLLWCTFSIAGEMNVFKKKIKLPSDVMQGYKNAWMFCCNYDPETRLTPDHAFKFVNKTEGHPVRLVNNLFVLNLDEEIVVFHQEAMMIVQLNLVLE